MATRRRVPQADPAAAANDRVLAERENRIAASTPLIDLGLDLKKPAAESAAEFLRDEFDKRNFGEQIPTIKRIVYGPDPLLQSCPEMRERIEQVGLEDYAEATREAILLKEEMAVHDPVLRKGLRAAIARFGAEQVADAFRDRILRIKRREIEVEVDRPDEMLGRPLDEAVEKFGGEPGWAYKFLSQRCIDVLGMRGYELVRDGNGDVVKVGTLFMGRIPEHIARRRREHWAQESRDQVREAEEAYTEKAERLLHDAGAVGRGSRPLRADEVIVANATESEEFLGQQRAGGVQIDSQL